MPDSSSPACVILGGGGHARVLIDCLQLTGGVTLYGVLDSARGNWGTVMLDVPVLGGDEFLPEMVQRGVTRFVVGLGGARDNRPRQRLFEAAESHGLTPWSVLHPSALISRWARLGAGCQILPGAVVNASAELGRGVIVNTGSIVEHDCRVGDHVHIASGAVLTSTVTVGRGAHVGAGATVRQGIEIGEHAVIGAGAVVVKNVAAGELVVGVPAHPVGK